jgi:hypothetical protein
MPNITENPDYRLVMTFLQNIRPGDMDQESSEQLMMIGQRIQAGGALTDREREMFEAVVGAMPQMPETEMSYEVDGRMESMSPQMMDSMVRSGGITQEGMPMDPNSAVRAGEMPMYDQRMPMDPNSAVRPSEMPSQDGKTYSQSSGVTPANNVMTLEEAVAAGIVAPTARPQARPAPMRPQARPTR